MYGPTLTSTRVTIGRIACFSEIEPAVEPVLGRRRAVHAARRQDVQLEREDQDEQDPEPPGGHRERDRREIGHRRSSRLPTRVAIRTPTSSPTDRGDDRGVVSNNMCTAAVPARCRRSCCCPRRSAASAHRPDRASARARSATASAATTVRRARRTPRAPLARRRPLLPARPGPGWFAPMRLPEAAQLFVDLRLEQPVRKPGRAERDDEQHQHRDQHAEERERADRQWRVTNLISWPRVTPNLGGRLHDRQAPSGGDPVICRLRRTNIVRSGQGAEPSRRFASPDFPHTGLPRSVYTPISRSIRCCATCAMSRLDASRKSW